MKKMVKHGTYKHNLILLSCALFIVAMIFSSWLIFPTRLDKGVVVERRKSIGKQKGKPKFKAIKKSTPIVQPNIKPDYSLPSVQNGMSQVINTVDTDQNVVFLGIDDGAYKDQSVIDIMKQNNIKASLFLTKASIASNPDFFKQLVIQGSYIENHTLSHNTKMIKEMDYEQQKSEICGMADYEQANYGRRPTLFRPPGGAYSDTMRQAAADCGMKTIVNWIAKANGGSMQYQVGNKLRPGDIVLMHFRPEFKQDMQAFVDAMTISGLHTALLEDAI
ncbi:MAG: polysaccharide deacetylase family protein [Candidatus Saccharibacteria bacterium]